MIPGLKKKNGSEGKISLVSELGPAMSLPAGNMHVDYKMAFHPKKEPFFKFRRKSSFHFRKKKKIGILKMGQRDEKKIFSPLT